MAIITDTTSAICVHYAIAALHVATLATPDEETADIMALAADHARDEALATPATDYADVREKLRLLITDAGCGLVEVEGLAFIARDLDALIGRLQ
ncbi:MAG: hypothetical protein C0429_12845 [Sphingopyxis sp.]|nr:hypothetical protein [Sphingopyxis sp.]